MPEGSPPPGPRVLVTRPAGQADRLIEGVARLGCRPIALPCLSIEPLPTPAAAPPERGVAIFTSRNAVDQALDHDRWPWSGVQALAIGPATAAALSRTGRDAALTPQAPFDSEALLAQLGQPTLPAELRSALAHGVTIVTGQGGRQALAEQLRRHGHAVRRRELYRRRRAPVSRSVLDAALAPMPDVVSSTSDESLDALLEIVSSGSDGAQRARALQRLPLVVNGDRCAEHAKRRGFVGELLIARPAGDGGQLAALARWLSGVAISD